jgi:hypothetical protein
MVGVSGKVVGNRNIANVSKFVSGLTKQLGVVEWSDKKDAGKCTRHNEEPAVDIE